MTNHSATRYALFVSKLSKLFIFWIVLFSLVTVLLENGISYHVENESVAEIYGVLTQDSHKDHADPCADGFCHLGHCSSVAFVKIADISFIFDLAVHYYNVDQTLLERSLEGPFQPPRDI